MNAGPRVPRSRPAWRVARALDELAGPGWTWAGERARVSELAGVDDDTLSNALRALQAERLLSVAVPRDQWVRVTWLAPRAELRAALASVTQGLRPLEVFGPCAAPGLARARCELSPGHTGPHCDGSHPALRRGEVLCWE